MRHRPAFVTLAAVVAAVVVAGGLAWFEPWRLVTDSTVDEALPTSAPSASTHEAEAAAPAAAGPTAGVPVVPDTELARGAFESAEHHTSGRAIVLALADGRRFLRLEELDTSDGPDLRVWLTDRPSGGGWHSYDDGRHLELGGLKANHGNQNYEIPPDADLAGLRSVVVWCDRFDVAFGSAPIEP